MLVVMGRTDGKSAYALLKAYPTLALARCRSGLREYGPLPQADWRPQ